MTDAVALMQGSQLLQPRGDDDPFERVERVVLKDAAGHARLGGAPRGRVARSESAHDLTAQISGDSLAHWSGERLGN